jgi:hypothetical protein
MASELEIYIATVKRTEDLLRRIANGDQGALNDAAGMADDLGALLHETGRHTVTELEDAARGLPTCVKCGSRVRVLDNGGKCAACSISTSIELPVG